MRPITIEVEVSVYFCCVNYYWVAVAELRFRMFFDVFCLSLSDAIYEIFDVRNQDCLNYNI